MGKELPIPNREIAGSFTSQIQQWFKETARGDAGKLERTDHKVWDRLP